MKFLCFLMLWIPFGAATQETEVKQLQLLLNNVKNNFTNIVGTSIATQSGDSSYRSYTSKMNLQGSANNQISIARDGNQWATYTAFISDSCSLNDAKRLIQYWRKIIHAAAPNYDETKKNGKQKTVSGHPFVGYDFKLIETTCKYWIDISYAERPFSNGYSVMFSLAQIR
jgi:hypothetical protein